MLTPRASRRPLTPGKDETPSLVSRILEKARSAGLVVGDAYERNFEGVRSVRHDLTKDGIDAGCLTVRGDVLSAQVFYSDQKGVRTDNFLRQEPPSATFRDAFLLDGRTVSGTLSTTENDFNDALIDRFGAAFESMSAIVAEDPGRSTRAVQVETVLRTVLDAVDDEDLYALAPWHRARDLTYELTRQGYAAGAVRFNVGRDHVVVSLGMAGDDGTTTNLVTVDGVRCSATVPLGDEAALAAAVDTLKPGLASIAASAVPHETPSADKVPLEVPASVIRTLARLTSREIADVTSGLAVGAVVTAETVKEYAAVAELVRESEVDVDDVTVGGMDLGEQVEVLKAAVAVLPAGPRP